jgi:thiamine phosphate synthase YjbQ (UPF0047 family)
MRHHLEERSIGTSARFDVADLTPSIEEVITASGIREGHVTVSTREPACALIVNEKETGLISDLKAAAGRLGDRDGPGLPLGSTSVMLPAIDGALAVGTWQRVLLVELDGKAQRTVVIQIVGD